MKILIVTQYFYPENFKSNDLAFELQKRGHDVTVLTGLPNYPEGKMYKGYGILKNRNQTLNGVKVIRSLLILRGKASGFRLMLNYFSFAFFASFRAVFLAIEKKFDAVIVHEPSPITQFIPALIFKLLHKTPIYFWVLDLWPESLQVAGNIHNKYVLNFFKRMTQYFYDSSERILIGSKGFSKSILEKGEYKSKLIYFPNWAEDVISMGGKKYPVPALPQGFRVLFAGNIGEAQDIDNILKAALLTKRFSGIKWIFLGDGRKMQFMRDFVKSNSLGDTVYTLGRFPIESMATFFEKSDVLLFGLKDNPIFNLTVPSRVQAYMSASKPIIGMINGEAGNLINEIGCGFAVGAGDYTSLADKIIELSEMSNNVRDEMGKKAYNYYERNFTLKSCIDNLENILLNNTL